MSDEQRRELERRWKETGDAADEAALLGERLRVGGLTTDRLSIAAALGHEAARQVLGSEAPPRTDPTRWEDGGVPFLNRDQTKRAAVAAARHLLAETDFPGLRPPLDLADVAVACPCQAHAVAVVNGFVALPAVTEFTHTGFEAAKAIEDAVSAAYHVERESQDQRYSVCAAVRVLGAERTLAAVAAELVPWLLGHGDPLRDRCEGHSPGALAQGNPPEPDPWPERIAASERLFQDRDGHAYEYREVELFRHPSGQGIRRDTHLHIDADRERVTCAWLHPDAIDQTLEQERRKAAKRKR